MKTFNVAVVGATGAVGAEMLKTLEQRKFPVNEIRPLASSRSAGKKIVFAGREVEVQELTENSFEGIDYALFSAGGSISEKFAPAAVKAGAVVIDNTSAFRMDPETPLVVPEVNPEAAFKHKGIIANPNCSTIQMVVALKPIYDKAGIKRVVVSTYQAVSGAGQKAIDCLMKEMKAVAAGEPVGKGQFPYQICANVIPQIDVFQPNGYTKEEMKMINETRKILDDQSIALTATTVRVPVVRGHSESVNVETMTRLSADEARKLLSSAPGVEVIDDPAGLKYPMPVDSEGRDATYVGRIRDDLSLENGIDMWVVSDNLRKGAALNAVQIAELLTKE